MPRYLAKSTPEGKYTLHRYSRKPTLKEMQTLLGGRLESAPATQKDDILHKYFDGVYFDEEGWIKKLSISDYDLCDAWNTLFFPEHSGRSV